MKKILFITLTLVLALLLCSCNESKIDPKYEDLIEAIENGTYQDALKELNKLMQGKIETDDSNNNNNNNNNNGNQETECPHNYEVSNLTEPTCNREGSVKYRCKSCGDSYTETLSKTEHVFSEATCTKESRCEKCNIKGAEELGHAYEKGYCTRCNEDDPEMLAMYNYAIKEVESYALHNYVSTYKEHNFIDGNPGGKYLYDIFESLGDYKDSKEYLARFSIIKDQVTYYIRTITDNLGNVNGPNEYTYQKYDKNGNIIFTEDSDFMEYYGIMAISSFSAKVFYDENNVVTKLHIHFVSTEIDTIVTPIYDENGVLVGSTIRTNTLNETLTFKYNDKGQRIYTETYDVWYHTFSARTYTYDDQGKLLEKYACEGDSKKPDSFEGKEMTLVHKKHYDENGMLQSVYPIEYSKDMVTYEVDSKGRIIKISSKSDTSESVKEFVYEDVYIYTSAN